LPCLKRYPNYSPKYGIFISENCLRSLYLVEPFINAFASSFILLQLLKSIFMFCQVKGRSSLSVFQLLGAATIDIACFAVLLIVSRPAEALIDFRLFAAAAFCLLVAIDSFVLLSFPGKASPKTNPETPSSPFAAAIVTSLAGNLLFIALLILLARAILT